VFSNLQRPQTSPTIRQWCGTGYCANVDFLTVAWEISALSPHHYTTCCMAMQHSNGQTNRQLTDITIMYTPHISHAHSFKLRSLTFIIILISSSHERPLRKHLAMSATNLCKLMNTWISIFISDYNYKLVLSLLYPRFHGMIKPNRTSLVYSSHVML